MFKFINKKSKRVAEGEGIEIDKAYLTVTCLGYFSIFWIMDYAARCFLHTSPFPITHIIDWIINLLGVMF